MAFNHRAPGCKPKDLIGIPWLVALALRGDGWYLRSSIIWHKTNPMPESTRDRPTRCYEYVFLLTKSKKYYYNWQAVAEPIAPTTAGRLKSGVSKGNKYNVTVPGQNQPQKINRPREKGAYADELICPVRSRRNVWQINNVAYHGGHFAAYPPKLAETCILAGCPVGGIVLDPFLGSGTTAAAAKPGEATASDESAAAPTDSEAAADEPARRVEYRCIISKKKKAQPVPEDTDEGESLEESAADDI